MRADRQTDKQTDRHTYISAYRHAGGNTLPPIYRGQSNYCRDTQTHIGDRLLYRATNVVGINGCVRKIIRLEWSHQVTLCLSNIAGYMPTTKPPLSVNFLIYILLLSSLSNTRLHVTVCYLGFVFLDYYYKHIHYNVV